MTMAQPDNDTVLWPTLSENRNQSYYKLKPRTERTMDNANAAHASSHSESNPTNANRAFVPIKSAPPSKQPVTRIPLVEAMFPRRLMQQPNERTATIGQESTKALPSGYKYLTPRQEEEPQPTSPPALVDARRCALVDFEQRGPIPDDIMLPALL